MNPPSQPAPQTRAFQWQLVFIAVMLLAAAVTSGLYIATTVQAESHGAITGLTLTSDAPGTLAVSWEATSPTPTDYRVDWAKSDEDYQSWKVDDGHVYLADTATTVTIADLEHDTEYKIRMRARYYRGEHEGKSWGGPWATATITVAGEPAETPTPEPAETPTPEPAEKEPVKKEPGQRPPRSDPPRDDPTPDDPTPEDTTPAAPSFINTAVTEGQVLLSWSNPSDDSITGYQISRGPDADSLVVIEDDTESSSTSYTDTAPPAGQTHTYGVKARNSAGLSPAGTATATVPAAEVLIVARHEDGERALVSNLGQIQTNAGSFTGTQLGERYEIAIAFTTGANPHGHHITSVQLRTRRSPFNTGTPNPQVSIRADNAGVPSETVLFTFTPSSPITSSFATITFTTEDATTLQPNTTYWLYATTEGDNALGIRNTASNDEDAVSNTDWKIADKRLGKLDGGTWTESRGDIFQMAIHGHAAPEFLVSNLDSPSTQISFSRETDTDSAKIAQAFSAADNTDGTSAEFDFHGVTVQLQSSFSRPTQLTASDMTVTVHGDTGGIPGNLVHTMTAPATYTVRPNSGPVTFSAPPGSILSSGITYWVKFEIAADSTSFTGGESIVFEFASDNNEVQGPTTYNRWSIGDNSLWSPETLSWTLEVKSINMSVLGAPHYDTLVSNIDQPFWASEPTGSDVKAAQSFLTPPGPMGQQYPLRTIRFNAASQYPTRATVDLHADDDGVPGDHLASMTIPGDFAPGEFTPADLITVAPRHTNLNPGTRYWIVISNKPQNNILRVSATESQVEDPTSLEGWEIDNQRTRSRPDNSWAILRGPIQMKVLGSPPFIRTDEADGPDLPGAGHNAHRTGAVVTPGIVSTGHLTPGLDRNHGLYGDYWWLDTKTGHRYRIEVKFGDSQNNDTGGSAWMSFIDPDHDDYPYASGCCEADHNRDDGHTFVHFRRPTDDWNNRYLVHIAAFDKLNTGSSTYNGPYTITMTDITGTEKVATNLHLGTRIESNLPTIDDHIQYAVSFTTGDHPGGYYKLDRVRMHMPDHEALPNLVLHDDASGLPGDGICDLLEPNKVQHHPPYAADNALPVPFRAAHCGRDAVLDARTTYWLVLEGSGYEAVFTDSTDQQTRGSGWTIGDRVATSLVASWRNLASTWGTIPVEIWASPTPPPNRRAAGIPLIDGERRVGKTLTADITGITDPEGLSNPRFTYSWIRGDGVDEESIAGEESETYTLTDDDVGQRIRTLVTFLDNEEERETAVGPATSVITPDPRVLVSNASKADGSNSDHDNSSSFVTGANQLGYSIDTVRMRRSGNTIKVVSNAETEYRLFTSVSTSDPLYSYPEDLLMTASPPKEATGNWLTFTVPSRLILQPNTPYQNALASKNDRFAACAFAGAGVDTDSLDGFSIPARAHRLANPIHFSTKACTFEVNGFEMTASPFVEKVEITSTPALEGMYATGDTVEATATLSEAVTFTAPSPMLLLQVGDNERVMEYVPSESADTSWIFRYTVVADDRDDNGLSFERNALRGYADADLSFQHTIDNRMHHVNAVPQLLSHRVSSKPVVPPWYTAGDQIEFTLEFSLPVTVVGDPQLEFSVTTPAPANEFASYLSGSGTRELVFSYTVGIGDDDDDGIWWNENSLRLDGDDSITGTHNGLDADLDHTGFGKLEDHRIDQNPRAVSQEVTSDPVGGTNSDTYGAGDAITFAVVFNQAVTVHGTPRLRFSITGGSGDEYATYVSGSNTNTLVFSYTVLAVDMDADGIYLYTDPLDYPDLSADSIVGANRNNLPAVNAEIGKSGALSGHKVDGSITN